ncbi:MAG: hypothetical protein ACRC42_04645 [Mycoplasma sp.]
MKIKKLLGFSILLVVIIAISSLFIVSCSSDPIGGVDSFTIINLIFPNIWVFLSTLVATIILFSAAIWMIWEPFNKKMDERKKHIQSELDVIKKNKEDSISDKARIQKEFNEAQNDIKKLLIQANQKANTIHDEIKNSAEKQAHILLKNAKQEIEIQKRKMQKNINDEILDIAFSAVTEISKQKITKEENDKLVEEFIQNLEKVSKDALPE